MILCFVAVIIMWWKLLYWFRIFESRSFYIKLIVETLKSIGWFTLIYIVFICAFANSIYVLDSPRTAEGSELFSDSIGGKAGSSLIG